jgi:hypothetical protein
VTLRIRHIAAMAALLALVTPLCALACLDESAAEPVAATRTTPPCHSDSAPEPSRETPSQGPGQGCECAAVLEPIAIDGSPQSSDLRPDPTAIFWVRSFAPVVAARYSQRGASIADDPHLPAPDILTLHATLLL